MTSYRHPSGLGGEISGVYIPTEYRERGHVFTDVPRDADQRSHSGADMRPPQPGGKEKMLQKCHSIRLLLL